ncbi:EpsD family peptidyl-prolyl cis-trans isomerase [Piscinibacter sp. HJYY11]|uniref:EpsD family peptidyl-prolyl cis-trans isomerase n=1 Tax=Piscinibacter sp. HJYY11 TaxID=2801333 RepID=UPI00192034FB|nr:EpsD family peptidyl-prolyl cis-trans isomerase [Piscinibacter sp. HJYY11]MBL0730301.1 EpsD family peptidyl-prolyl cis-trans isomerase [Piscinibacter sp. HJYY11]
MNTIRQPGASSVRRAGVLSAAVVATLLAAACSKSADKPASQVAAKVNKQEITVHQLNHALQSQRTQSPEQAQQLRKQTLERLIDQELAVQKASELKLDREPRVMQQIEAARREIIARNYFDRVAEGAGKPSDSAISQYYAENPALFAERRVYQLQEWVVEVSGAQADDVRAKAQAIKDPAEFSGYLRAQNLRFEYNQAVRPAEQLPLASLPAFAKMKDGDTMVNARPNGLQVVALVHARSEPVEPARARPAVEQFLLNRQKAQIVSDDIKALRTAATVQYLGEFAAAAGVAPPASDAASQREANPK